ncbi:MAG: amidase [Clostridia bacterium]|nr:amidase [Clostridia bacterium]
MAKTIVKRVIYIIISIALWIGVTSPLKTDVESATVYAPAVPDIPVVIPFENALVEYDEDELIGMLFEASISEISQLLESGVFTSEEITEYYLERIAKYNPEFNCFITLCDEALETAKLRDQQRARGEILGKLHGVPIVIKDNIDLEGYPTTNGENWRKNNIAADNAHVVQKLIDAGAIIIGKTNMSTMADFAEHSISQVQGETKNAYSFDHSPGGSSGGSAVAVSLNFAAAALGTDTNSSLRIPSAYASTVSLRTSYGLIDKDGVVPLVYDRDVVGTITRTVEDQALMLDVMTDNKYSFSDSLDADYLKGAKIGYIVELCELTSDFPFNRSNVNMEILDVVNGAIKEMEEAGATIIGIDMPNLFYYNSTRSYDAIHSDLKRAFEKYDLDGIVFPSCLSTTPPSGFDANGEPLSLKCAFINPVRYFSSPLGIPEICVPVGYTSDGLSIGMEILGLKGDDMTVLNVAYSYEQATHHRTPSSLAPNLYEYGETDLDRYLFILNKKNNDLFV